MIKFLTMLQPSVELGLICSLAVLALYLSYTMLNVCDLSTEGCFMLGAAVGALLVKAGHPYLAIPAAMLAGMVSGLVTATLQTRMGVNSLLAGIVVNTALYSVNQLLIGSQVNLVEKFSPSLYTFMKNALAPLKGTPMEFLSGQYAMIVNLIAVIAVVAFLSVFLRTKLGLAIRATGDNPDMVRSSSINPSFTTTIGLCISNSFTGLAGCLMAMYQKNAEIKMGSGMLTIALASLLIGGTMFRRGGVTLRAIGAVIGAVIFRLIYQIALTLHLPTELINAVSAVIVVIAIAGPYFKSQLPVYLHKFNLGAGKKVQ